MGKERPPKETKEEKHKKEETRAKAEVDVLKEKSALSAVTGSTKVRMVPGQWVGDIFHGLGTKDVKLKDDFFEWGGRTYHVGDAKEVSFFLGGKPYMLYDQEYAEPLRFSKGKIESFFSVTLQRLVKDNIIRNVAPKGPQQQVQGWGTGTVIIVLVVAGLAAFVAGAALNPFHYGQTLGGSGTGSFSGGTQTITQTVTKAITTITSTLAG